MCGFAKLECNRRYGGSVISQLTLDNRSFVGDNRCDALDKRPLAAGLLEGMGKLSVGNQERSEMTNILHKPYAGKKLSESPIPGAAAKYKCAFCDKIFKTSLAAGQHEKDYHAKLLGNLIADGQLEPQKDTVTK